MNRSRAQLIAAALILAFIAGVVLALRDTTPRLTRLILETQRTRWRAAGVANYSAVLKVVNDHQGVTRYDVTVHNGEMSAFRVNGVARKAIPAWSMSGLLDIIDREIEMAEREKGELTGAVLRARFDEVLGFPRVYKRIASGKSTFVEVESFEITGR